MSIQNQAELAVNDFDVQDEGNDFVVPEKLMHDAVSLLLKGLGESLHREGLQKTPVRFIKALKHLTQGYEQSGERILSSAIFHEGITDPITVNNIDIFSLCEHHLLPFWGKMHIRYIPNGRIVGLSKIVRVCEVYSRRLQVQERLTAQIADVIYNVLRPKEVSVKFEASHMCMMIRGVQQANTTTVTHARRGVSGDGNGQCS